MRPCQIVGLGTTTAVGFDSAMAAASIRAGICRFTESNLFDQWGEPIVLSTAQYLDDSLVGMERLIALAERAAVDALGPLSNALPFYSSAIPLCLGLAESTRVTTLSIGTEKLVQRLSQALGTGVTLSFIFPNGHAAGIMALERACQMISEGKTELALAGAVDSFYDARTLACLDGTGRLYSERNLDGFTPGEGAGFCLVASSDFARRHQLVPYAHILALATAMEPYPLGSPVSCMGQGLTKALRNIMNSMPATDRVDWTMCDMNGESFRAKEWNYAYLRTGKCFVDPLCISHPADCHGDLGAASGLVLTGVAAINLARADERGRRCLVWSASDGPERAAVLLEAA